MTKNKHFRRRLLVLLFSITLFTNGLVLYAKNETEPNDSNKPAVSTDLHTGIIKETEAKERTAASSVRTAGSPSLYTETDSNVAKIVRNGEDVYFTNFRTALSKTLDGEELILLKDVPAAVGYYTIDKSITLNLNGNSIDGLKNYTILINKYNTSGIKVTIKNGAIYSSCDRDYDTMGICMPLYIRSCGNVTLDNVKLEARPAAEITGAGIRIEKNATPSSGSVPRITVNGKNTLIKGTASGINILSDTKNDKRPELIINGGLVEGGSFGIAGNGANDTTSITVNGGTIKALNEDGTSVYHPQDGDLTVNGGNLEGKNGIQFCGAGSLSITGGTITAAADSITSVAALPGSGSILDGAALSVLSRGGEYGAAKSLEISITGGILKSLNHTAILEYSSDGLDTLIKTMKISPSENQDLRIISGNQKDAVIFHKLSGEDAKIVSGGRFSSILPDTYCADHYVCRREKDSEKLYKVVPRTYSLTYDYAGGKLPDGRTNPSGYTYFDDAFTLVNPQKEGYDFVGWTGDGITSPQKEVTIPAGSQGEKTYTAVYSPKESRFVFKTKTDDVTISDRVGKTDDAVSDRTMPKVSARKGYVFVGWFDQKGHQVTLLPEKFPAGTTVYTAKWNFMPLASDPNIQVEVPEISADGTGISISENTVLESARQARNMINEIADGKVPAGMSAEDAERIKNLMDSAGENESVITVLSFQTVRKEQAAAEEQNAFNSIMLSDERAAAYFDLTVSITVHIKSPDGTVRKEENASLSMLETPLLFQLHVNAAWIRGKAVRIAHVHNGKAAAITPENINRGNGSIGFYAKSFSTYAVLTSEHVEITFDTSGGTRISPQKVKYGGVIARPKDPVKKGYTFSGWYSDKGGKEVYDFKTKVQNSFTLYAKWSKQENKKPSKDGHSKTPAEQHTKSLKAGDTADFKLWSIVLLASAVFLVIISKKLRK